MKKYLVTTYKRQTVFDKNLNLVYRWYVDEKHPFSNQKEALKYFKAVNRFEKLKAVMRIKRR